MTAQQRLKGLADDLVAALGPDCICGTPENGAGDDCPVHDGPPSDSSGSAPDTDSIMSDAYNDGWNDALEKAAKECLAEMTFAKGQRDPERIARRLRALKATATGVAR